MQEKNERNLLLLAKSKCGYENDHIAIINLNRRGSLSLSTAPHMRYVAPNQLRGTFTF